jgi:hypothetical protein
MNRRSLHSANLHRYAPLHINLHCEQPSARAALPRQG